MARHGSASAEHPSPTVPTETPRRGGGPAAWPIRRKLAALVALPTALVIGLIGFQVAGSYSTWQAARHAQTDAETLRATDALAGAVSAELRQTFATVLLDPKAKQTLPAARTATDSALKALLTRLSAAPDALWSRDTADAAADTKRLADILRTVRALVDGGGTAPKGTTDKIGLETLAQGYEVINDPLRRLTSALADELGGTTPNPSAVDTTYVLDAITRAAQRGTSELSLLTSALHVNRANPARVAEIEEAAAGQNSLLDMAASRASDTQRVGIAQLRKFDTTIAAARTVGLGVAREATGQVGPRSDKDALSFANAAGTRLEAMNALVTATASDLVEQTSADRRAALLQLIFLTGLGLASLVLVVMLVSGLARTITVPMRRLRSGAVDSATVRLPAAVRQIEREGPEAVVAVPPVLPTEAKVGPETREVAQALDGLTAEAIRLATSQVRLRQSLDEAFVSMSRRSQAMVEKQLAIIDELESTEEDPEQLRNLFRLDHLAARMRRYNDNLLVLAGSAVRTRSNAPVPIADVFRAATSEMEQYERVRLQPLSGASVAGAAAGGLIHLLAELLDNAAMYSPPTSPIVLSAAFTHDGGLRLEVTDSGVGIPPAELADLNARLAMPGTIDTQVPSRMGMYVVARLAQRGAFGVRLSARPQAAGTVAEVTVPKALVLGAPTGPLDTIVPPPAPSARLAQALEGGPRLPSQHSAAGTPIGGLTRPTERLTPPQRPADPAGPDGPAAPGSPPLPSRTPAPAASTAQPTPAHAAPAAASGTPTPSGLPSRRPGAALAGNPLAGPSAGAPGANPMSPMPPMAAGGGAAPTARAGAPAPASAPAGDVPRNGAAAGIDAARRRGEQVPGELPRREPGMTGRNRPPFAAPAAGGSPFAAPGETGSFDSRPAGEGRDLPKAVPGRRPGARPLPVRAPGQPGGGPALGPSAATAVAGAASARPRPSVPLPDSGLFASAVRGGGKDTVGPPTGAISVSDTETRDVPDAGSGESPAIAEAAAGAESVAPQGDGSLNTPPPAVRADDRASAPAADSAAPAQGPLVPPPAAAPVAPPSLAPPSLPTAPTAPAARTVTPSPFAVDPRPAAPVAPAAGPIASSVPLIGGPGNGGNRAQTPIFDSISVWFADDRTASVTARAGEPAQVIDLREGASPRTSSVPGPAAPMIAPVPSSAPAGPSTPPGAGAGAQRGPADGPPNRWASLGDQRWIATNLRAAAAPETAGSTSSGLPRRRPGANLLPSAAAAAGTPTAVTPGRAARRTDAESVRGRLGSYQRGLSSARRARHLPPENDSSGLFHGGTEAGRGAGRQGGDS